MVKQLCYGLEEYRTGKHVPTMFTEAVYRPYYRDVLQSLREMDSTDEDRPCLDVIRNYIADTGR